MNYVIEMHAPVIDRMFNELKNILPPNRTQLCYHRYSIKLSIKGIFS